MVIAWYIRSRVCTICSRIWSAKPEEWTEEYDKYKAELIALDAGEEYDEKDESEVVWCYRCLGMSCRVHVDRDAYQDMYWNVAGTNRFRCEWCLFHPIYKKYQITECRITGNNLHDALKLYVYIFYVCYMYIIY